METADNDRERAIRERLAAAISGGQAGYNTLDVTDSERRFYLGAAADISYLLDRVKELEDNEVLWEAMKRGVSVRIGDLETRVAELTRERDAARAALEAATATEAVKFKVIVQHLETNVYRMFLDGDYDYAVKIRNQPAPYKPYAMVESGIFLENKAKLDKLMPAVYTFMERLELENAASAAAALADDGEAG